MNLKKVIVADDHDIFTMGLKVGIEKDPLFQVIKEASNGEEVINHLKQNKCDLLICDYMLPGIDGIAVLTKAKKIQPKIKTILISSIEKFELQKLCDKYKIDAYFYKTEARTKIVEVAKLIFEDKKFRPLDAQVTKDKNSLDKLTNKQLEILQFWMSGKSMDDTGELMKINSKTVETHRTNIRKKFDGLTKEEIFSLFNENFLVRKNFK